MNENVLPKVLMFGKCFVTLQAATGYGSCGGRKSMSRVANKVKLKYFGNQVFIKT